MLSDETLKALIEAIIDSVAAIAKGAIAAWKDHRSMTTARRDREGARGS